MTNALPLYYVTPIAQHAREQEQLGKTVTVLSLGLYLQPISRTSNQKKKHEDKRLKNTDSTKKKTGGHDKKGVDNEIVLGSVNHNVKCFNCNEMGHMSRNCPKRRGTGRQGRGRGRFGGRGDRNSDSGGARKCYVCGTKGHIAIDCFELSCNEHKRPQGWKSTLPPRDGDVNGDNHTSNAAVQNADNDRNEMTLPIVDIPLEDEGNEYAFSMTLLNNPAYWIGDTGATRHTSGCPLSSLARVTPETSTSTMAIGLLSNKKAIIWLHVMTRMERLLSQE
jgi:hypothetical protein